MAIAIIATFGKRGAEFIFLTGGVILLALGVIALVAYMLFAGQFPPRLDRSGVQLPAEDLADTAKSLRYLKDEIAEIRDRIDEHEALLNDLSTPTEKRTNE
jgi:hypothetical protein